MADQETTPRLEEADVTTLKKERGNTKAAITRTINAIERIDKVKENVEQIEQKLQDIPVLIERFEEVHLHLMDKLTSENEEKDALAYRVKLMSETETFEQSMHMWIAGEADEVEYVSEEDTETQEKNAAIENDNDSSDATADHLKKLEEENSRAAKSLEDAERAVQIEKETFEMKMKTMRAQHELKSQKLQNQVRLLEEAKAFEEERRRLEERLQQLSSETEQDTLPELPSTRASSYRSRVYSTLGSDDRTSKRVSFDALKITPEQSMMETIADILSESRSSQQTIVDTLQLPAREISKFDGNPLKYWTFIQSFMTTVGRKNVDDASKLSCLLHYCTGQARKVLECTEMLPSEQGYKRALEILEARFGDSFKIAQQWISQITERSSVKGATELREFADDLQCCQEMLKTMGHIGDLDNAHSMRLIWKKLPQYLQDRWTRKNYELKKREKKSKAELKDLVQFVIEAAEEATDPIFSRDCPSQPKQGKKQANVFSTTATSSSSSSSTPAVSNKTVCPSCEQLHFLTQCQHFKSLKIKDRRDFVMKKGLCLNCLVKGHLAKDCPRNFRCTVDGCGMKHSKFLHFKPRTHSNEQGNSAMNNNPVQSNQMSPTAMPFETSQQVPQTQGSVQYSTSNHFTDVHSGKIAMPIVPARVYGNDYSTYIDTYALLDTGSNGSYCTEELQRQLAIKGRDQSMELTTLTNTKMKLNCTVVTLNIGSADDEVRQSVEATVRPHLNIDVAALCTRIDIKKWPHLHDLVMPDLCSKQVQLLIGQNASDLLMPCEVRRGAPGEPFAVRTPLGWAVNGPVNNSTGSRQPSCHFISNTLDCDLKRMWDIESVNTEEQGWSIKDNPGDDASRGLTAKEMVANNRWMHGPAFLYHSEHEWPKQPAFKCSELESQLELKSTSAAYTVNQETDYTSDLLNYFSSWYKLKRAVVWFRRFQKYLQKKKVMPGPVKVAEMKEAENVILRYSQKAISNTTQMKKLNPMKGEDGLLRVGGRLTNSQFKEEIMRPVILPYKHHVSKLIIVHDHQMTGHAGVERVLGETRKRFWILKGRKLVKSIVHKCIKCKRNYGNLETQKMSNLPESRVTAYEPPFSRAGVDYFGPFIVRRGRSDIKRYGCVFTFSRAGVDYFGPFIVRRGRSDIKRYGCVFTCFATRAVHIEMSHTLDTDSFIHALDRFIARRGEPKEIWSDNGSNFVGAHIELKKAVKEWNQDQISNHLLKREIDWHFNPPAASHMGGVWERQIRTIRKVLMSVISQQTLDDEALMTLLTVVEGIVNGRPITRLSDDPRDDKPLTPNHLLILRSGSTLPAGKFVHQDRFRRRWKQVQYLADIYWKRWIAEYVPQLQERQKWLNPRRNVQVGDLVLVSQSTTPRNQWPLGLVIKTHEGSDNLVRSVEVKTASGTYERPISKLCLLEGVQ